MEEDYKDIFKRHFDKHVEDADAQDMWQAIKVRKRRRGPKRKGRGRKGLIIIILTGLGLLVTTVINNLDGEKQETKENASLQMKNVEESNVLNTATKKDLVQNNLQTVTSDVQLVNPESKSIIQKDTKKSNAGNSIADLNSSKVTVTENLNQASTGNNSAKIALPAPSLDKQQLKNGSLTNSNSTNSINESSATINSETIITEANEASKINSFEQDVTDVRVITPQASSVASITEKRMQLENLVSLDLINAAMLSHDFMMPLLAMVPSSVVKNVVNEKKEIKKQLGLIAGSSYGLLSSNYNSLDGVETAYSQQREATEKNLEAISAELLLDYKIGNHFSISSGIAYTRLNELFQGQTIDVRTVTGEHQTGVIINGEGEVQNVFETGSYLATQTIDKTIYNKTDLLAIPLNVNFHKSFGKINASIFGGVRANVNLSERGTVLNEDGAFVNLGTDVVSKIGLGYAGGLRIGYDLTDKIGLSSKVGYTSFNKEQNDLVVNYGIIDLGLSLAYRF